MTKSSVVVHHATPPISSAKRYLTRRRGWAAALALLWLLGLGVLTAPQGSTQGGMVLQSGASAHASLVSMSLQRPELKPSQDLGAAELANASPPSRRERPTNVAWGGASPMVESDRSVYNFAVKSFRDGRYAAAFGRFTQLADGGHMASAESALFMLRHGQELFGVAWSASEDEQLFWQTLVARNGHELVDNSAGD